MHRLTDTKVNLREKLLILFSAMVTVLLIITVYRSGSSPTTVGFWSDKQSTQADICDTKPCIELRYSTAPFLINQTHTVLSTAPIYCPHYRIRSIHATISSSMLVKIGLRRIQCPRANRPGARCSNVASVPHTRSGKSWRHPLIRQCRFLVN